MADADDMAWGAIPYSAVAAIDADIARYRYGFHHERVDERCFALDRERVQCTYAWSRPIAGVPDDGYHAVHVIRDGKVANARVTNLEPDVTVDLAEWWIWLEEFHPELFEMFEVPSPRITDPTAVQSVRLAYGQFIGRHAVLIYQS